jgi:hypothetical protein
MVRPRDARGFQVGPRFEPEHGGRSTVHIRDTILRPRPRRFLVKGGTRIAKTLGEMFGNRAISQYPGTPATFVLIEKLHLENTDMTSRPWSISLIAFAILGSMASGASTVDIDNNASIHGGGGRASSSTSGGGGV